MKFQEILYRANRATLEYLQAWAGVTRTGYHGTRVDGREPGRFEAAGVEIITGPAGTGKTRVLATAASIWDPFRVSSGQLPAHDVSDPPTDVGGKQHRKPDV